LIESAMEFSALPPRPSHSNIFARSYAAEKSSANNCS
jgi:hypothetical protein